MSSHAFSMFHDTGSRPRYKGRRKIVSFTAFPLAWQREAWPLSLMGGGAGDRHLCRPRGRASTGCCPIRAALMVAYLQIFIQKTAQALSFRMACSQPLCPPQAQRTDRCCLSSGTVLQAHQLRASPSLTTQRQAPHQHTSPSRLILLFLLSSALAHHRLYRPQLPLRHTQSVSSHGSHRRCPHPCLPAPARLAACLLHSLA